MRVSDSTGYSSLLPEAVADRPSEVVANSPGEMVLEFPVRMTDDEFDAGLMRAAENVRRQDGVANGGIPR